MVVGCRVKVINFLQEKDAALRAGESQSESRLVAVGVRYLVITLNSHSVWDGLLLELL